MDHSDRPPGRHTGAELSQCCQLPVACEMTRDRVFLLARSKGFNFEDAVSLPSKNFWLADRTSI